VPTYIEAEAFGDVVMRRHADDTIEVVEAPPYARIDLSTIAASAPPGLVIDGRDIVIAGTVAYRPVEFDPSLMVLICQLVRDDRPTPQRTAG
jgi:hypothetical protein